MRAARILIGVAAACASAATVAACGGSGSHPATAQPSHFRGSELQAALLPPNAFGTALKAGQDAPETFDAAQADKLVAPAAFRCPELGDAGTNEGAISAAAASVDPLDAAGVSYTEGARQYAAQASEKVLSVIQTLAANDCKSFDVVGGGNQDFKTLVTVAARSGVGDQALLLQERTQAQPGIVLESDILMARYGSVVIRVSAAGTPEQLASIDLAAKVEAIAANLKLG